MFREMNIEDVSRTQLHIFINEILMPLAND
jgi:hypothetical protein